MKPYLDALCWAVAMGLVAVAGANGWIDESSMATLLVAIPALLFAALSGEACTPLRRA
jgi:hypothetical protein